VIGISFRTPNKHGQILKDILNEINFDKYYWHITETQAWKSGNQMAEDLFEEKNFYDGHTVQTIIDFSKYYVVFANITAFLDQNKIIPLENYNEYLKSECQMAIFIVDVIYVDVYCKDIKNLEIIKNNAIQNGYTEIKNITEENDRRTRFSVW